MAAVISGMPVINLGVPEIYIGNHVGLENLCNFAEIIIGNGYIYNYIKRKDKHRQGSFGFD